MLLCIDAGNTRIKWGLRQDERWLAHGAVPTGEPVALVAAIPAQPVRAVIGCNVAGEGVARAIEAILQRPVRWNTAQPDQCGVRNGYENPQQLGADRWAALIGAHALEPGPCLVVVAGTATTVDVLDAAGQFRGGLILPGLSLMARALAGNTAGLPAAPGSPADFPCNTRDAIASGAVDATLGAIERLYRRAAAAQCLVAGGAAEILLPRLELPRRHLPLLVLEGLARIGQATTA
jgi:type III pantothenate kinase